MRITALVPAYHEAQRVGDVVRGVIAHLPCLVVDDGSGDGTAEAAAQAGATVVRHERNAGKGAALRTGFAWARDNGWDGVVTLDADGQHDPAAVPQFVAAAENGAEIVIGARQDWAANGMPWIRRMTNGLTSAIISRMAHCRITDSQSGYRYVSVAAYFAAAPETTSFDAESELLIRAGRLGLRIGEVPIPTIYGTETSKINPLPETVRFIRLFLRYMVRKV
ncbi:MAG: glycosyltransferase family 2 protein [Planctomycetes bacterium]|nr:glycosyltransferase family 2 protein [Planctomycetota bacterium]